MRVVLVGAGSSAVMAARFLTAQEHEVVIVDRDKSRIDELVPQLDCGFIHGDASVPVILRETDPEQSDFLFCLTNNSQTNIIVSLVGRSMGFKRVITKIENPQFEHICLELGLADTILPAQTIGRYLADMVSGQGLLELSAFIKDEARVFSFIVAREDAGSVASLELPAECRVICLYRDGRFLLADTSTKLKEGDEVVLLLHSKHLSALAERWSGIPKE